MCKTPSGVDLSSETYAPSPPLSTTDDAFESEPIEAAQDALTLLNISAKDEAEDDLTPAQYGTLVAPAPTPTSLFSPTPSPTLTPIPTPELDSQTEPENERTQEAKMERRSSTTWKGFKFKKQLSKVDLKIKSTFSGQSDKNKKTAVFHVSSQGLVESPSEQCNAEVETMTGSAPILSNDVTVPRIEEPPCEERSSENSLSRPVELNLFADGDEKPMRPTRRKDRKRVSLEKQMSRDTRLLSVPNIKYQHAAKDTRKSKPSNNQAFFNLIRRLSKCFLCL